MKKNIVFFMIMLGTCFITHVAKASEFKVGAQFANHFVFAQGGTALAPGSNATWGGTHFRAINRTQFTFDYIANENLSGTIFLRGTTSGWNYGLDYGEGEFDSAYASPITVRLAYIDWKIPSTDIRIRMGYQPLALPMYHAISTGNSPQRASGISFAAPINDNIQVNGFWVRGASDNSTASYGDDHGNLDTFALSASFNYEGFRVSPWVQYLKAGRNVLGGTAKLIYFANNGDLGTMRRANAIGYDVDVISAGIGFEVTKLAPFRFALDAFYTSADYSNGTDASLVNSYKQDGYFVGASASYATSNGTPLLRAWYASGGDTDDTDSNRDGLTSFLATYNTSILFADYAVWDMYGETANGAYVTGTWGVSLEWANFSFLEKLSHTARLAIVGGTNDINANTPSAANIGEGNTMFEANFNTVYKMYDNLNLVWQLGYLTFMDVDYHFTDDSDKDIIRCAFTFVYNF